MTDIPIIDAIRTPSGAIKGEGRLQSLEPTELLAGTLRALQQCISLDQVQQTEKFSRLVTGASSADSASRMTAWLD